MKKENILRLTNNFSSQAPQLIGNFFSKLKMADKVYQDAFEDELRAFRGKNLAVKFFLNFFGHTI